VPESRGAAFSERPGPAASGEAVNGALSLVDGAAEDVTAFARRTGVAPEAPTAVRHNAPALDPDDPERL
jgi:hypothetical protein